MCPKPVVQELWHMGPKIILTKKYPGAEQIMK